MVIETARLLLVPLTPRQLLALFEGGTRFEEVFGVALAEGYHTLNIAEHVSPAWLAELRQATEPDLWRHGWGMVHRERNLFMGMVGPKGPPTADGVVEIGYGVAPSFEGQGLATEAAGAVADFLIAMDRVTKVIAHTLPAANASTRVLAKCGFVCVGEMTDPEDGLVWRWERGRAAT